MRAGLVAGLAYLSLIAAAPLAAQAVRGKAVLPDSTTPLAGAIVQAKDDHGATAGRGLTGRGGAFIIALPHAGRYQLELLRIGYRPTIGPAVNVGATDTASVVIVFAGQAVTLAAVDVRERETCRVGADSGLMVARVWEEARKAMLTTQLSTGGAPLFAEWIEYDRTMDSTARMVRQQHVRAEGHPTTHAFKSLPAATLDEKGYVVSDSDATMYYAPDAEVLLSDSFVADHCFHLVQAPAGSPALVGVGFQPTRRRGDMHEIEGTLWVDRASAELRTLEFQYTNLPDVAEPAHAGGRVEFLRLADGNWLISRWTVRMPRLGTLEEGIEAGMRRAFSRTSNRVLRAVQITGGEVTRVLHGDSVVYQATGPALVVQVVSIDPLIPAAGAKVSLDGTDYTGIADASGRVRLTPVLAGRYSAHVQAPIMDTLRLRPVGGDVEVIEGGRAHVDSLKLPSSRDALAGACPRDSIRSGEALLHGRATDTHAQPLDHAAVTVVWQSDLQADPVRVGYSEHTLGALTNSDGYWQICGVPRNVGLSVRLASDSGADLRRAHLEEGESRGSVDLVAHAESKAAREAAIVAGPLARPKALVEFAVLNDHDEPIPNVTLDISGAGGVKRTLVTGPTGRALIPEMPPGRLSVKARHIGFREGEVIALVAAGRNTVPIVLSGVSAPMLDTVRVLGDRRVLTGGSRFDEFEQRRINGEATVSITRDDIIKRNPVSMWQMLNGIPSIRVVDADTMVIAVSSRTMVPNFLGPSTGGCFMAVGINGQLVTHDPSHAAVDLRTLPSPEEVYGVEVFAGAATIPLQYGGVGEGKWCGMIMIWTR